MAKKIGFSGKLKLTGNIDRILEMSSEGIGDNAISGHFIDNNIDISPQFVREVRIGAHNASKKALPKKEARKAINVIKRDLQKNNDVSDNGSLVF